MKSVLVSVLALLSFSAHLITAQAEQSKDPGFCELILAARGDETARGLLLGQISDRATTTEGLAFLEAHLDEYLAAGLTPENWSPLATLPEAVTANLYREDGGAGYEVMALLRQGRLAEEEEDGVSTPSALSAQRFLLSYRNMTVDALTRGSFPEGNGRNRVSAVLDWIKAKQATWNLRDPYQASAQLGPESPSDLMGRASSIAVELAKGVEGFRTIYAQLDEILASGFLPPDWRDLFNLRPVRTPNMLAADGAHAVMAVFEVVSVLRMIRIAHDGEAPVLLRDYAREWMDLMLALRPQSPKSQTYMDALREIYTQPRS